MKGGKIMDYFPLNFSQITNINSINIPSTIKQRNNRAYCFWVRAFFERAMSVFEFRLPENWTNPQKDLMKFCLAHNGYGMVAHEDKFGYFFQPCRLTGYGFFYQPIEAILSNPLLNKIYKIGIDCQIVKMTPDYLGIWDIIDYYAVKASQIDSSINTALVNSKNAWMIFAKNKSAAAALKKAKDLIDQGEPAVVFDSKVLVKNESITNDNEPVIKVDLGALDNAQIVGIQLQDLQTILTMFDTEIGIQTVGGNQAKKERLTQFESESKQIEAEARCSIWLRELKDSFAEVNKLFPELDLGVEFRVNNEDEYDDNEDEKDGDLDAND